LQLELKGIVKPIQGKIFKLSWIKGLCITFDCNFIQWQ
jgi:hypothetical protein